MTTDDLIQIIDSLTTQLDKMQAKFQSRIDELEAQISSCGGPYTFTPDQEALINTIINKVKAVDDVIPDVVVISATPVQAGGALGKSK